MVDVPFLDIARIDVRWADVDRMQHVNNVVHFRWMEIARTDYFSRVEFAQHVPPNVYPILASIRCDYRAQLRHPDVVRVSYSTLRIGTSSVQHGYRIWSEGQKKLVAEGDGTWICFDYGAQRPLPLPEPLRRAMEGLEGRTL
jgi:acyl-CoA thioester hydrolase